MLYYSKRLEMTTTMETMMKTNAELDKLGAVFTGNGYWLDGIYWASMDYGFKSIMDCNFQRVG